MLIAIKATYVVALHTEKVNGVLPAGPTSTFKPNYHLCFLIQALDVDHTLWIKHPDVLLPICGTDNKSAFPSQEEAVRSKLVKHVPTKHNESNHYTCLDEESSRLTQQ